MGCYVNPRGKDKMAWLMENGENTLSPCAITETHVPVCLVDNGPFTAAGVAYDARELNAFDQPNDFRPKFWFKVPREKLYDVSDLKSFE